MTIPFGHVIEAEYVRLCKSWPDQCNPRTAPFRHSLEVVIGEGNIKPRRGESKCARLLKGKFMFNASKVSDFGEPVSASHNRSIHAMRAVTIRVNDTVTGVAGLIAPSDRIDLTLTRTVDQNLMTSTILAGHAKCLALINRIGKGPEGKSRLEIKTVTVQVEPAMMRRRLALAQQAGTLSHQSSAYRCGGSAGASTVSVSVTSLSKCSAEARKKPCKRGLPSDRGQ